MSIFLEAEEEKVEKKLTGHNLERSNSLNDIKNNNFSLAISSKNELPESQNIPKDNKAQATTDEQSNLDPNYDESKDWREKVSDDIKKQAMIDYFDQKIRKEAYDCGTPDYCFPSSDREKVYNLLKRAAKYEHPEGQYNLAMCYSFGDGCNRSLEKAAMWYTLALLNGCEESEGKLKEIVKVKSWEKWCLPF